MNNVLKSLLFVGALIFLLGSTNPPTNPPEPKIGPHLVPGTGGKHDWYVYFSPKNIENNGSSEFVDDLKKVLGKESGQGLKKHGFVDAECTVDSFEKLILCSHETLTDLFV